MSGFVACRPNGRVVKHVLNPRYLHRTEDPIIRTTFADVNGNGRDQLVTAESSDQATAILRVYDHDGRLIFEHENQQQISEMRPLPDPVDRSAWIFHSYATHDSVLLGAVRFDRDVDDLRHTREIGRAHV